MVRFGQIKLTLTIAWPDPPWPRDLPISIYYMKKIVEYNQWLFWQQTLGFIWSWYFSTKIFTLFVNSLISLFSSRFCFLSRFCSSVRGGFLGFSVVVVGCPLRSEGAESLSEMMTVSSSRINWLTNQTVRKL